MSSTCAETTIFVLGVLEALPALAATFYTAILGFAAVVWLGGAGIALGIPALLVCGCSGVAILLEVLGSGRCCLREPSNTAMRANLLFAAAAARFVAIGAVIFLLVVVSSGALAPDPWPPSAPPPPLYPVGFAPPPSPPWHLMQPPMAPQTWPAWPPNPPNYPTWPSYPPNPPLLPPGTYVFDSGTFAIWFIMSLVLLRIAISISLDLYVALSIRRSKTPLSKEKQPEFMPTSALASA